MQIKRTLYKAQGGLLYFSMSIIQQYIELPAGYSKLAVYSAVYSITSQVRMYSCKFNSTLNYQPVPKVQLVIQQYIELPAVNIQLAVYSAVYSITSQIRTYS